MVYGIIAGVCVVVIGIAVLAAFLTTRRKKVKPKSKETNEEDELAKEMERFEKSNFKKCRNCGANVPIDQNLCLECGSQP